VSEGVRRLQEATEEARAREEALREQLEEARLSEQARREAGERLAARLEEEAHERASLGLRLGQAEGRARGLELGLSRAEGQLCQAWEQLQALASVFRRGLGLELGSEAYLSPSKARQSPLRWAGSITDSASGSLSPDLGNSTAGGVTETDLARAVEGALKQLLDGLHQSRAEKEMAATEGHRLRERVQRLEEEREHSADRLQKLHTKVTETEE
ncbi:hypothetical protein chiPu_0026733, partial [Chiloscyllium punctatum]|nr:hypothetical protein [Chiloscyllium punctatum]